MYNKTNIFNKYNANKMCDIKNSFNHEFILNL